MCMYIVVIYVYTSYIYIYVYIYICVVLCMNHHESIHTQMIQLSIDVISKASCKSVRWQKLHCSPPGRTGATGFNHGWESSERNGNLAMGSYNLAMVCNGAFSIAMGDHLSSHDGLWHYQPTKDWGIAERSSNSPNESGRAVLRESAFFVGCDCAGTWGLKSTYIPSMFLQNGWMFHDFSIHVVPFSMICTYGVLQWPEEIQALFGAKDLQRYH